jgi:hypothetical protein
MAKTLPPSCANFLEILGASTSWSPKGLSRPVMGELYFSILRQPMAVGLLNYIYRSLKAIVAKPKICPFWVNTEIELKTITTTNNNNKIQLKSILSKQFQVLKLRHISRYTFLCSFLNTSFFDLRMFVLLSLSHMIDIYQGKSCRITFVKYPQD